MEHLTDEVRVANVIGATVGECLKNLVSQIPRLEAELFRGDGKLEKSLNIFINGESAYPEELEKQVKDGDYLNILNVVTGG
jgi:molybdopterin converting factor small subunit